MSYSAEEVAERMAAKLRSYVRIDVEQEVRALKKTMQLDADFLEILIALEKRVRLLEQKS